MDSLRDDGEHDIYEIEVFNGGKWRDSGYFHKDIPQELRFIDPPTAKATPLFKAYNDAWQVCGIHGWFKLKEAMDVMQLLAEYVPDHRFRVVLRKYLMRTTVVAEMQMPPKSA